MATRSAADDARYMARALELAEAGWGRVHPNPMVGAVVVRDGEVVGEGAHREYGGPHAEVEALRHAGERARGATLYVTLEPCGHQGKTPPCTDAIEAAGVARVVYAEADPDLAARGGEARLRAAGVEVEGGVGREQARRQNALFLIPTAQHRPFLALKFGLSLDARIAAGAGQSTRVTGREAEAEVHRLRAGFDAILVGGRTAEVDDPRLTVRLGPAPRVPPVRVVADPDAGLDPGGRLARTAAETPVWLLVSDAAPASRVAALEERDVRVLRVTAVGQGLDPIAMMETLWQAGVRTVLCEGGGRLGGALLEAERVDRLYLFLAPRVFGSDGVAAFPGGSRFHGAVGEVRRVGEDVMVIVDRSG